MTAMWFRLLAAAVAVISTWHTG